MDKDQFFAIFDNLNPTDKAAIIHLVQTLDNLNQERLKLITEKLKPQQAQEYKPWKPTCEDFPDAGL